MSVADRYFEVLIERLARSSREPVGGDRPRGGGLRAIHRRREAGVQLSAPATERFRPWKFSRAPGTIVGFRPIVESTMISFHRVWGDMGARQYRFIHAVEGYGKAILRSHQLDPEDTIVLFSHSGVNAVILDIALGAKELGMTLIAVTSLPHSSANPSRHSSGKRLFEAADVVIDTGAPPRRRLASASRARGARRRQFDQRDVAIAQAIVADNGRQAGARAASSPW